MSIKIGDRVRFLNSVGGGVVSKFINKDTVSVLEDDGFETPSLIRECVIVENINKENNLPQKESKPSSFISTSIAQPEKKEEVQELFDETPEGEKLSVLLAFVPQDIKTLQNSWYDLYLINDSNYTLYYTISMLSEGNAKIRKNGVIQLNTTLFLEEITNAQLNDFEKINVQLLAFKTTKSFSPKPPVSLDIKIKPVNLLKLHSFTESDYFDELSMLVPIIKQDVLDVPFNLTPETFNKIIEEKEKKERPRIGSQKQEAKAIIEKDLHINELLDTTTGMSAADIIDYQLSKFHETIAQHKNNKGQRIVFIHGKGNGVLRNEIIKQLKTKYSTFTYQDASFREYGFGATMITIK
jgi:DNA-nicking Smr family endonuclease